MSVFILEVEVEFAGKARNSTHAIYLADGQAGAGSMTGATLAALGWPGLNAAALDDRTDTTSGAFGPASLIESIIGLHRYMQHASAIIRGVYIKEVPTDVNPTAVGISKRLALSCEGTAVPVPFNNIETANNTLYIAKNTLTPGADAGGLYLRGAVTKEATVADGLDGVTIEPANLTLYQTNLNAYLANAGSTVAMSSYFVSDLLPLGVDDTAYVVVNTAESLSQTTREGNPRRVWSQTIPVVDMEVVDAVDRNTRRRGRRSASGSGTGEV